MALISPVTEVIITTARLLPVAPLLYAGVRAGTCGGATGACGGAAEGC